MCKPFERRAKGPERGRGRGGDVGKYLDIVSKVLLPQRLDVAGGAEHCAGHGRALEGGAVQVVENHLLAVALNRLRTFCVCEA